MIELFEKRKSNHLIAAVLQRKSQTHVYIKFIEDNLEYVVANTPLGEDFQNFWGNLIR